MEKNLVTFEGKSDLPGKPMQYGTTRKFLEIFGLRNLKELPTLSQIDELLPEGITDEEEKKTTLSQLTDALSEQVIGVYSQGEEDLMKITDELAVISTSSDFFEQEKLKQKQKRESERAQSIREAILVGESVSNRDRNWLQRFDEAQLAGEKFIDQEAVVEVPGISAEENVISKVDDELSEEQLEADEKSKAIDEDDQLFTEESLEANDIAEID
jgi:segregation and condensation protein B